MVNNYIPGQIYNTMVEAYVTSSGSHIGYINGQDDTYTGGQNYIFIYSDTSVNGRKYRDNQNSLIVNSTGGIYTEANLTPNTSYYTGKVRLSDYIYSQDGYNYTKYYPRPNNSFGSKGQSLPAAIKGVQDGIPYSIYPVPSGASKATTEIEPGLSNIDLRVMGFLPLPSQRGRAGSVDAATLLTGTGDRYHEVPTAIVYPSSVDTVNIEFSDVDSDTILIMGDNRYYLEGKTMTFKYDYKSDFNFVLSDGIHNRVYEFNSSALMNRMTTIDNNYYYINNGRLITNDTNVVNVDGPVNIYDKQILLSDGTIYDIEKHSVVTNSIDNLSNVAVKPLYSFNYIDEKIDTFYSYSLVNDEYYEGQLFVKDNNMEIIDKDLDNKKNKIIIDRYNGKNYLLYLGNDGIIYSLKDNINYPSNFSNVKIKDISSNPNINTDLLFVLYEDGNYMVFNYKTGTLVENNTDYKPDIFEYISMKFTETVSSTDLDKPVDSGYIDAENLVNILTETPIDDVLEKDSIISKDKIEINPDGEKSFYSIKYNPKDKKYEVFEIADTAYNKFDDSYYSENSVIVTQINNPPADEIIKKSEKLNNYYNLNNNLSVNKVSNPITISIIAIIGTIITILIGLLGDLVIRKIKVRSNAR